MTDRGADLQYNTKNIFIYRDVKLIQGKLIAVWIWQLHQGARLAVISTHSRTTHSNKQMVLHTLDTVHSALERAKKRWF